MASAGFLTDVVLPSALSLLSPKNSNKPEKVKYGSRPGPEHDDEHTFREIAEENGFTYEQYNVTTEDGYILWLDRVLPKNVTKETKFQMKAPVVLLQHGIEDVSLQWVCNDADKSPAFMLAEAGFDVWLGNNRGNHYSQGHINLDSSKAEFWEKVDFELMGTKDLPAMIDFILQVAKDTNPIKKLAAYIGHSEGTTQMFIGQTLLPDYFSERVSLFAAFAPVVRLDHVNKLKGLAAVADHATMLIRALHVYDLIDMKDTTFSFAVTTFCKTMPAVCEFFDAGIWNLNATVNNAARKYVKFANVPGGAGWKNVIHYAQIVRSSRFQRWDYGSAAENQKNYGSDVPPEYDLTKCSVPTGIFSGDLDDMSTPEDVKWLVDESKSQWPSSKIMFFNKQYHFTHGTFSMAIDMSWFNNDVIPLIKKHMKSSDAEQKFLQ